MRIPATVANAAWGAASLRRWMGFRKALRHPETTQRDRLLGVLHRNRGTAFGRAHGFASVRSVSDFQAQVPIRTYDDFRPYLEQIGRGGCSILTSAPVERLVPSSGSTAAAKLVPFTAALRREFGCAVDAWIADVFLRNPGLSRGPAYWSVTPAVRVQADPGSVIPVGFDDDSEYLGGTKRALARAVMAVPAEVARLTDAGTFRYVTVRFLLQAHDLRLISVWHPTFLECLIDTWIEHRDRLIRDLTRGTVTSPFPLDNEEHAAIAPFLRAAPDRAAVLRRAAPADVRRIWPHLALISGWGDGAAGGPLERLSARLPGVHIQPKGLLATEGVISIPFGAAHPVAVTSHFLEFLDENGRVSLAHELRPGAEYSVILTTGGGLYRYRLGDRVRVDGFVKNTPSIRFMGRDDRVSDQCGEKLSDGFVTSVIASIFAGRMSPRFTLLAPERTPGGLAYTLFVDDDDRNHHALAAALEEQLRRNPHYAWCVDIGQLRPARVVGVDRKASQVYIDVCVARGQRLGDVKPPALRTETGWSEILPSRRGSEATPC